MRANVYTDAALAKHAGRFVWLSIDTEQQGSAAFLEQYPVEAWPTLFVVDPPSGAVALKWLGSATVPQLELLLGDAERLLLAGDQALSEADALFDQAARHGAAREAPDAVEDYRTAIQAGGPGWPRRTQAIEALVLASLELGDLAGCAGTAVAEAASLPRGPSFANVVATGLSCAMAAEAEEWRATALAALEPLAREAVKLDCVLADDRSSVYDTLVGCRKAAKDPDGAKKTAEEWLSFLESEAAKARTPAARSAFDAHRVTAALELGDPGRAIPALQLTERDLPDDYNAPARLAQVFLALGRHDEAVQASDRALAKVYGPRRLRLLENRADILSAKGDRQAARLALEAAQAFAQTLPEVQRSERQLSRIESRLKALDEAK